MKLSRLKLHYKIVIPFIVLSVLAALVIAFVSLSLISDTLESRLQNQIERTSAALSQAGFALNPSILESLGEVVDAEIITYTRRGEVLATTLNEQTDTELVRVVLSFEITDQMFALGEGLVLRDIIHRDVPYRIAYRPLITPPDTVVAFVTATSDIAAAEQSIARTVFIIVLVIVLFMSLASQLVARRVTAPVLRLVEFTKGIASGGPTGTAPVSSDDEIGKLAESFNEMVSRLRESEERLLRSEKLAVTGLLAARVAHDIRNPLSAMKMRAQLLQTTLKPAGDAQNLLPALLREIDRVEWVVKGLLELSRPGELSPEPAQMNDVVEEVLREATPQLRYQKIEIETRLNPDLPRTALDVDRFKLALLNVIVNAAEAMPNGGTLLATTGSTGDTSAISLEICDDGVGLDSSIRDRLFDPFVSTKREGVGLGLVNTKHIVESHGGTIAVVPRRGRGTRVRIVVPVRTVESLNSDDPNPTRDASRGDEVVHGGHSGRR